MQAYTDDLAYIHDVGHGDFARQAAPFLLELLRQRGLTGGQVVDLGCGSGIWAELLVRAGYTVVGADISPGMLAIARKRVSAAQFRLGSFLDVDLPDCVAVTAISEIFNFGFDQATSREALASLFRRVYQALTPGGLLVFDVLQPGHAGKAGVLRRWREGDDWAVLVEIAEDRAAARLVRRITSFRKVGKSYRRNYEVHQLILLRGAELAADLRRVGFRVTQLRGYGATRFPGTQIAFVARKP